MTTSPAPQLPDGVPRTAAPAVPLVSAPPGAVPLVTVPLVAAPAVDAGHEPDARPGPARRALLERRVRVVVAATITWNVVEAAVAIAAGRQASSSALIGFGLDSLVEVLSAAAVAWQFAAPDPRRRERTAMRLIAVSFLGLAALVTVDAVRSLLGGAEPEASPVGIALAALSLAVMPFLSWFERRTGHELGSASAVADSRQTLLCAWLSAVLLAGLLLTAGPGWTWADPLAALVIAAVAVREGLEAWRGDACCAPAGLRRQDAGDPSPCADGCCDD